MMSVKDIFRPLLETFDKDAEEYLCAECQGSGTVKITCKRCKGTGWVGGRVGGTICCGGVDEVECEACKGDGK